MPYITVSEEQARLIVESADCIEIRDHGGRHLGFVTHQFMGDDIAIARARIESDQPRYTTQEVLNHLESLGQQ
jgi:hypothetical protein